MHDCVVIGGGIVGLATARALLQGRPGLDVVLLEKEAALGAHQTAHNSGVLHAGIYYARGSLKARLCREGKRAVEELAAERGIRFDLCGKLVVALDTGELGRLDDLFERSVANGVPGVRMVGPEELREIEPHAVGIRALHSPSTGIIDFSDVASALADDLRAAGGAIRCSSEVRGIRESPAGVSVVSTAGDYEARAVVACAGLQSDRVARLTNPSDRQERIIPFRGDYYRLTAPARALVRGLIYPVPDPRFPFLGVHLTRRVDGEVWAGPNAVLALRREGYRRRDIDPRDVAEILGFRGFWALARRNFRYGLSEVWRDVSKGAFLRQVQRYVPALEPGHLVFGPSGVRAQSVRVDGSLVDDFSITDSSRVMHVRNAPSPAATASLAIGASVAARALDRLVDA